MTHGFFSRLKFVLLLFCSLILGKSTVLAQCGVEDITITDWCENTYANWSFDNPTPDASYIWYGYVDPTTLVPADFDANGILIPTAGIPRYDSTGATEFYTPFRVKEANVGTFLNLTYQKIISSTVLEYSGIAPTLTPKPANTTFEVDFTLTEAIRLNSIKVPVVLSSPTDLYKLQVSFGTSAGPGSAIYEFSGLSATNVGGNNYIVEVPVNYNLGVGAQTLVVNTNPTGSTANVVDNVLFSNAPITPSTGGAIEFGAGAAAVNGGTHSVVYDWDYTIVCEPLNAGESNLTTAGCCVVPPSAGGGLSFTVVNDIIVDGGAVDAEMSIAGGEPTSYYAWYLNGVFQPGVSGVGSSFKTWDNNETGVYEMREVLDPARVPGDLDNPGCYSTTNVLIQDQLITLNIDGAPLNNPICLGDEYDLSVTGTNNATWTATNGILSNYTGTSTTYSGTGTGSGLVEVTGVVTSNNLLLDGDFSSGNESNFFTDYSVVTNPASTDGGLTISNDALQYGNSDWDLAGLVGYTSFTGNNDNFLIVNDGRYADSKPLIWGQQTATGVIGGEDYVMSFDMTSLSWIVSNIDNYESINNGNIGTTFKDVTLEVFVDGQSLGTASTDFATNGYNSVHNWNNYSFSWTAPADKPSVAVEIRMTTPGGTGGGSIRGYDFGIDNVYFGGLISQTLSTTVGPYTDCSTLSATQSACDGDERVLTALAEGGMVFSHWEDPSGTTIGTQEQITVAPLTPTVYTAVGFTALGNLLDNGSFANGATGFEYGGIYYKDGGGSIGGTQEEFIITENTGAGNSAWIDIPPRPGSSDTEMFVADAKTNEPMIAWTFNAIAGQDYQFEGWGAHNHFYIDQAGTLTSHFGVSIIPSSSTPSTADPLLFDVDLPRDNDWYQLKSTWTAPADGEYTFYVRNLQTTNGGGNDIVLDDFTLYPLIPNSETRFDILVENCACDGVDTIQSTYCGTMATWRITDNYEAPGGTYVWYDDLTAGNVVTGTMGGTWPEITLTTDISNAEGPKGVDEIYTLYVEDSTVRSGSVASVDSLCSGAFTSSANYNQFYTRLQVFDDISMKSVDFILNNTQEQFQNWLTPPTWVQYSGTVDVGVYSAKLDNGKYVPDALITTSTLNYDFEQQGNYAYTVPFDYDFVGSDAGTYYFVGLVANSKNGSGNFQAAYNNCTETGLPIQDDLTGDYVHVDGSVEYGNVRSHAGFAHNIVLEKGPNPSCPRIPVDVIKNCPPCNKPLSVTIVPDTIKLCVGADLLASGTYDLNGLAPNNGDYYYSWHTGAGDGSRTEEDKDVEANYTDYSVSPVAVSTTGYVYLRVEDGDNSDVTCYTEDSVYVEVSAYPDLTITVPNNNCSTDLADGVWVDDNNTGAIITYHSATPVSAANELSDVSAVADGTYYIYADNNGCTDEESVVVVNNIPDLSTLSDVEICSKDTVHLNTLELDDANLTNSTITFEQADGTLITDMSYAPSVGEVISVIGTLPEGCADTVTFAITVLDLPEVTLTIEENICDGEDFILEVTDGPVNGSIKYKFEGVESTEPLDASGESTITLTPTTTGEIIFNLLEVEDGTCVRKYCE